MSFNEPAFIQAFVVQILVSFKDFWLIIKLKITTVTRRISTEAYEIFSNF